MPALSAVLVYWPMALVLAYSAISAFYVRRSRDRGVGSRVQPYVVVGIALSVLLAEVSLRCAFHPIAPKASAQVLQTSLTWNALITPVVAIGLGLLVLAWVEHNVLLLVFTAGYLVVVLAQADRVIQGSSQWSFLPQLLIPAAVLALGSGAFALYQASTKPRS